MRHDARLRSKLTDEETGVLAELLDRLASGLELDEADGTAPTDAADPAGAGRGRPR